MRVGRVKFPIQELSDIIYGFGILLLLGVGKRSQNGV